MARSLFEVLGWVGGALALFSLVAIGLGYMSEILRIDVRLPRDPMGWWIARKHRRTLVIAAAVSVGASVIGFVLFNNL